MGSQSKIIFPTSSYISFNFLGLIIKYAIISEQICCQLCRRSSLVFCLRIDKRLSCAKGYTGYL